MELENRVDGDGFVGGGGLEHPWLDVVELGGGHAAEGQADVDGAGEVGEAEADVAEGVAAIGGGGANAGDAEERWAARAEGQRLDQRRPLEAVHEVEVDHMHPIMAVERLQYRLVRREVGELEVRAGLVEMVVEYLVLHRRRRRRRRHRRRSVQPSAQTFDEAAGDLSDATGGADSGQQRPHLVEQLAGGDHLHPVDALGAAHEQVNQPYPGVLFVLHDLHLQLLMAAGAGEEIGRRAAVVDQAEALRVDLGEDRVDPGGEVGGVVVDGLGGKVGGAGAGVGYGRLEPLEPLCDIREIGGADPVAGVG